MNCLYVTLWDHASVCVTLRTRGLGSCVGASLRVPQAGGLGVPRGGRKDETSRTGGYKFRSKIYGVINCDTGKVRGSSVRGYHRGRKKEAI